MIRQVHHSATTLEGEGTGACMIRRKFIPVELYVEQKGQYLTFRKKIPFRVRQVVGVIITHTAPDHQMHTNRVYVESSPNIAIDPSLICALGSSLVSNPRACYSLHVPEGQKLYYAQPKRLGYASLVLNDQYGKFRSPVECMLQDPFSGLTEAYRVWESKYSGLGTVELCIEPDTGDDPDNDEDEDDDNENI